MTTPMPSRSARAHSTLPVLALLVVASSAWAQETAAPEPIQLETIEVTATRSPHSAAQVPASISIVAGKDYRSHGIGANVSEKLLGVPGILARDRQNYAQDEQISIRGFGARASFGVRGVRLYVDGIPATMPDGQGQVSHFNLAASDRIEILRGPFSALYGNSSGGVLQIFTADGATPALRRLSFADGSFAIRRLSLDARGQSESLGYNIDLTDFRTDGFRAHSAAARGSANAKFDFALAGDTHLRVLFNAVDIARAQDPLGLSREQMRSDPRQAASVATTFDTRKSVRQAQLGAIFETRSAGGSQWRLLAYAGDRAIRQFLAIPIAVQANPLHGGGVVVLASPFSGVDARWSKTATLAGKPLEIVAGLGYERQQQHRRGYENFIGASVGVQGALRRDEIDRVDALDPYAQLSWNVGGVWSAFAGLRDSRVRFVARDHFQSATNPDDSGSRTFSALLPVAGVDWHPVPALHAYLAYGRGFETPTFDELGYRPDGGAGLNFALRPARSDNAELGAKLAFGERWQLDAALFRADTRDELAIATNAGGRSTYQNVGRARRQGAELAIAANFGDAWRARAAYTYLDARFRDPFLTCLSTPCPQPTVAVPAGTRIPGVPPSFASASLHWGHDIGAEASIEVHYVGAVSVNNADTQRADAYSTLDASVGYAMTGARCDWRAFVGVDNLFGRNYAGSVIVNDGNGRYYEPAPGLTWRIGFELSPH